jgi:ABC-type nitrate/sulfonate/bicarbonate transport system permease component
MTGPSAARTDGQASPLARIAGSAGRAAGSLGGVVVVLVALEVLSRAEVIPSRYFPPISKIFGALVDQLGTRSLWAAVLHTLQGWFWGLLVAVVIAIPLGILLGSNDLLFHALRPVVEFLRPVPSVALIPLAILQFGVGLDSKIFLAAFAAVWPLLIQTMYGVRDVKPMQLETARSYQIRRRDVLGRVILPSIVPYVATGVRLASAVSLILTVTAELVIGVPGLGESINVAQSSAAIDNMYALIIVTGLLGWVLNGIFVRLERFLLHWHPAHREAAA